MHVSKEEFFRIDKKEEEDAYRTIAKVIAFKKDLKAVFEKHKVVLKETHAEWYEDNIQETIMEIRVDGQHLRFYNFNELLHEVKVIQ